MDVEEIEISRLNKAPWNYKRDDSEMAEKLTENIRRNGILQPSVVYRNELDDLVILDGNHRLDSYRRLELDKVPCLNLGELSDAEAKRIAIELNETKFDNDPVQMSELIMELSAEFGVDDLTMTLPYSDEDIEELQSWRDTDWNELERELQDEDMEEEETVYVEEEVEIHCPHCGAVNKMSKEVKKSKRRKE